MTQPFDILGLGCTAVDELLYVSHYPPADGKVQVNHRQRQCGGLTATALVAAARLGSKCVFAGTLGDDDLSQYVLSRLQEEGIDISHVYRQPTARPIHSVIVVDESTHSRAIFFDTHDSYGAQPLWPAESVIRAARVLFVDPYGADGMIRAARVCRENGTAIVADFESDATPRFAELLDLVDHLILSIGFARKLTGGSDASDIACRLWSKHRKVVIVTDGERGCWCVTESTTNRAFHYPAYDVESVDTTGCGDVFHGAYASALARGLPIADRIRFASASAALKTTRRGGQTGIPSRTEVEELLSKGGQK